MYFITCLVLLAIYARVSILVRKNSIYHYFHFSNHAGSLQICSSPLVNDGEFAATLVIAVLAFVIIIVLIVFLFISGVRKTRSEFGWLLVTNMVLHAKSSFCHYSLHILFFRDLFTTNGIIHARWGSNNTSI